MADFLGFFERSEAAWVGNELRARHPESQIVLASGCFDVLHVGHVRYLEEAAGHGHLVVALNTDESVRALKGPNRPRFHLKDRLRVVAGLRVVSAVISFPEADPRGIMEDLRPQVFAKGPDYADAIAAGSILEAPLCARIGCRIIAAGEWRERTPGAPKESSSDLVGYFNAPLPPRE